MESSIFIGKSIIAAVIAGSLALFAPCCISFMLPTYFASFFQNRVRLVAGHSFIVVGPDGRIRWQADYGGAPDYTMYVPIATLLTDMKEGLNGKA